MSLGMSDIERAIQLLNAHPDYRVLERIALPDGVQDLQPGEAVGIACALDVETTGLDCREDRIIELALRRFRYSQDGRIIRLDCLHSWREDPGRPIPFEITRITGLGDDDVRGQSLDETAIADLLRSADLIISHNCAFDRGFLEQRLPQLSDLCWSCSLVEIDWRDLGMECSKLGWLLFQHGYFFGAHRAGTDVDALIELLRQDLPDGATVLGGVVAAAHRDSWLVQATGAHYDCRSDLKRRGYRWSEARKVWWREVTDEDLPLERAWMERCIYAAGAKARSSGPSVERLSARSRYRVH